ncbi:MAG TPA: hypothetical protein VGM01_12240 [Ktedonobacteraceae bacterium]
MRKRVYLAILTTLIAGVALVSGVSPAFASTRQTTVPHAPSAMSMRAEYTSFHPRGWLTHNQYFHGSAYSGLHLTLQGHNQNNVGNQGYNRGYNRDFGANGGNLIINRGWSRYQRTNQYFFGNSYNHNSLNSIGYNQNNTGNQGDNQGINEDHAGNGGNQMVN